MAVVAVAAAAAAAAGDGVVGLLELRSRHGPVPGNRCHCALLDLVVAAVEDYDIERHYLPGARRRRRRLAREEPMPRVCGVLYPCLLQAQYARQAA